MAINILAWNMQGSQSHATGLPSYTQMFQTVLPAAYKASDGGPLLLYLCEAGNPWNFDPTQFKVGAVPHYFNSAEDKGTDKVPFSVPRGFAVAGVYVAWQNPNSTKSKSGKSSNLRCSVMMLELVKLDDNNQANFSFEFAFTASGSQDFNNKRPFVYAFQRSKDKVEFTIGGAHNVSNQYASVTAINNIVKNFRPGASGGCFVGDMNLAAPISSSDKWPTSLNLGKYLPMLSGQPTQKSGNQLDWGFQNIVVQKNALCNVVTALKTISTFEKSKYSGLVTSDHEIMFFRIN